jgi:hypothetical protein
MRRSSFQHSGRMLVTEASVRRSLAPSPWASLLAFELLNRFVCFLVVLRLIKLMSPVLALPIVKLSSCCCYVQHGYALLCY